MKNGVYRTGLIGRGIGGSRSPWMHESEARAQGLKLTYELFDFAVPGRGEGGLAATLDAVRAAGFSGVNVTHPYKQAVIESLDGLSDGARRIGAVNTVEIGERGLIGHNTDASGFADSFRRGLGDIRADTVLLFGAGGAGLAVANAMMGLGVKRLVVHDLGSDRVESLLQNLGRHYDRGRLAHCTDIERELRAVDGVVNATPMGMAEHPGTPFPVEWLREGVWVADIVYFPLETALLKAARETGCRTLDGSGMAVAQAAAAFEIFTGHEADVERMRATFLAFPGE